MAKTVNKRFRYVKDDDAKRSFPPSNGYLIPAEEYAAFKKDPAAFADYRLSHAIELYTFERVLRDR